MPRGRDRKKERAQTRRARNAIRSRFGPIHSLDEIDLEEVPEVTDFALAFEKGAIEREWVVDFRSARGGSIARVPLMLGARVPPTADALIPFDDTDQGYSIRIEARGDLVYVMIGPDPGEPFDVVFRVRRAAFDAAWRS